MRHRGQKACRAAFHTLGREARFAAPPGERMGWVVLPSPGPLTGVLAGTRR